MPTKAKKNLPPGTDYLRLFGDTSTLTIGDKCECNTVGMRPSGAWLVEHAGKFYAFDPSTQLQKDIWLGSAKRALKSEEKAIAMLRWWCFACKTVQAP